MEEYLSNTCCKASRYFDKSKSEKKYSCSRHMHFTKMNNFGKIIHFTKMNELFIYQK